jgi:hypothetical protein
VVGGEQLRRRGRDSEGNAARGETSFGSASILSTAIYRGRCSSDGNACNHDETGGPMQESARVAFRWYNCFQKKFEVRAIRNLWVEFGIYSSKFYKKTRCYESLLSPIYIVEAPCRIAFLKATERSIPIKKNS